jgi:hypothetical protein
VADAAKDKPRLTDRVREKLQARRARKVERARHRAEHQRDRERRGEVGRHGTSDDTGYTAP